MTPEEKIEILKKCYTDVVWMAARYAHGRRTYAPTMVRGGVKAFQEVFPDWEPKQDHVIEPKGSDSEDAPFSLKGDYLDDIFNKKGI